MAKALSPAVQKASQKGLVELPVPPSDGVLGEVVATLDPVMFRRLLMSWYGAAARALPWRGSTDPYQIWVSEIMLQQTRVTAVIAYYDEFLNRFPTLVSLALASEADVLAAWSGLGYYRRARMLHKAAQFIVLERDGRLPATSAELRTLPGIGEYTAAAIASIAFGEPVAVVDGNVERVILRLVGRPEEGSAAARTFVREQVQALMPGCGESQRTDIMPGGVPTTKARGNWMWNASDRVALAATVHPTDPVGGSEAAIRSTENPAGDHNQAMMELGATVCLPRAPMCEICPVYTFCRTRGEHVTQPRAAQRSVPAAYLLDLRKRGTTTEVLLLLRHAGASLMPAMFELPGIPVEAVEGLEPVLRVRHSITNTNYYVQVFAQASKTGRKTPPDRLLRNAIVKGEGDLHWANVLRLTGLPLTGLARKTLQRLKVMESARMNVLE